MSTDDPAVFDPNTWYQLSEARVDIGGKELKHNLVISDSPISFGVLPNDKNYWQFVPVDEDVENRWFMRSQKTGTNRHLATCWHPEEKHEAKTRLCIALADDDAENQMWESYKWDDGAEGVRFINVKNGSDWWLDVHKGNPPFMNDDIDMDDYKPAQRWFVSSMSAVEEESFIIGDVSATKTDSPGSTASATSSPDGDDTTPVDSTEDGQADNNGDGSSSGLSAGASAGIGVGVAVAILAIVAVVFFLMRRRKQNKQQGEASAAATIQTYYQGPKEEKAGAPANPAIEAPTEDTGAREVEGFAPLPPQTSPSELEATGSSPLSPGSSVPTMSHVQTPRQNL